MKSIPDTSIELGSPREEIEAIINPTLLNMMVEREDVSPEYAKLLVVFEKQYSDMIATMIAALEKFELVHGDRSVIYREAPSVSVPSWGKIKNKLNAEVLAKARKLEEPILLLIPPVSRQTMVQAIDAPYIVKDPKPFRRYYGSHFSFGGDAFCDVRMRGYATSTFMLDDNDLWNGGEPEGKELSWEVTIVTGVRDIKADKAITGTNYQRAKEWVKKYSDLGVDVMNDARTYLALVIRSLAAGEPIDKKSWTVLNAKNCTETSLVGYGGWRGGLVYLYNGPVLDRDRLRLRGSVRVL